MVAVSLKKKKKREGQSEHDKRKKRKKGKIKGRGKIKERKRSGARKGKKRKTGRTGKSVFFFQAEDGIRDTSVTGVQTCALPILDSYFIGSCFPQSSLWESKN